LVSVVAVHASHKTTLYVTNDSIFALTTVYASEVRVTQIAQMTLDVLQALGRTFASFYAHMVAALSLQHDAEQISKN